jgi:hypothetical protein
MTTKAAIMDIRVRAGLPGPAFNRNTIVSEIIGFFIIYGIPPSRFQKMADVEGIDTKELLRWQRGNIKQ